MTGVDEKIDDREDESSGKCWVKRDLRSQAFVIMFSYLFAGIGLLLLIDQGPCFWIGKKWKKSRKKRKER